MESSVECMSNDVVLMTLGGGYHASGVILGSVQVQGGRGAWVTYEVEEINPGTLLWVCSHPGPISMTDLTCYKEAYHQH